MTDNIEYEPKWPALVRLYDKEGDPMDGFIELGLEEQNSSFVEKMKDFLYHAGHCQSKQEADEKYAEFRFVYYQYGCDKTGDVTEDNWRTLTLHMARMTAVRKN